MNLRTMMWKYNSPSFQDQMAREGRKYKLTIYYEWKLSDSFTLHYSEEKKFDSNDNWEDWLLDEYMDEFTEAICDGCDRY